LYRALPDEVRELADRAFELLKANPKHPSIHFKPIGPLWSARVGQHYRALAKKDDNEFTWFWIGTHAEYDSLISR